MSKRLNMIDTLDSVADPDIVLKKVEYVIELEGLDAVRLSFSSKRSLIFGIEHETDSILMLSSLPSRVKLHDVSSRAPWRDAINKFLVWGWELCNNRGYRDGVQLQFGPTLAKAIQLVVVASSMKVYESTLLETQPFLVENLSTQ